MPTVKEFKPPKSLAQCADLLYETRNARLELAKEVERLAAKETVLREHLIQNLPKSDALGISGKLARVTVVSKDIVSINDWDAFYKFLLKEAKKDISAFSMLQKRVGESAVKERWNAGEKVPGLEKAFVPQVSINKV